MNIHLIAPALPPQLNGIGDYTACLAAELSESAAVTVYVEAGPAVNPLQGIAIRPAFRVADRRSIRRIADTVALERPDWLMLQYNPFCYGRWGINPHLPLMVRDTRRRSPRTRFALVVHEPFVPLTSWRFALEAPWQRLQLRALGKQASLLFMVTDYWERLLRGWFPADRMVHLPVGSSIPEVPMERGEARARLEIAGASVVLALFGQAHASRSLALVRTAARAVEERGRTIRVLYMGPHPVAVREALPGLPLLAEGPLPPEEVSRRFRAVDIALAPFTDGVSTRRTSMMTGLQHGIATVGTRATATDRLLIDADGHGLVLASAGDAHAFAAHVVRLASDSELRERIARGGAALYAREFAWKVAAGRMLERLGGSSPAGARHQEL